MYVVSLGDVYHKCPTHSYLTDPEGTTIQPTKQQPTSTEAPSQAPTEADQTTLADQTTPADQTTSVDKTTSVDETTLADKTTPAAQSQNISMTTISTHQTTQTPGQIFFRYFSCSPFK